MGVHQNISFDKFPEQGESLGKEVKVCFNYDTQQIIEGKIIRDDMEDPYLTIIQLKNDRIVLATECQYSYK